MHLVGKDPETKVQRGHRILKWGECDTSSGALNTKVIDYICQQGVSSFQESPFANNFIVKHAWCEAILG